jgi:hypothetical protein
MFAGVPGAKQNAPSAVLKLRYTHFGYVEDIVLLPHTASANSYQPRRGPLTLQQTGHQVNLDLQECLSCFSNRALSFLAALRPS